MRKTNKNAVLVFVLLLLVAVSAMMVASTYAKYTAEVSGSGKATVAKWAFKSDNETVTINVDFSETYDETTLKANRIAPGTSGTFDLVLSNANSEVGVDYTVSLGTVSYPKNLVLNNGNATITGTIPVGGSATVKVPWEWAYYVDAAEDAEDTTDGEATSLELTVPVTITGVQVQPQ